MIIFVWAIGKCQENGWCCHCCNVICSRLGLNDAFKWLAWRNAFVHGIATCLILTYGDLVSISFFLLTPAVLNVQYNTDPNDIPGGPWRSLYNGDYAYFGYPHYWFGIGAIIVVVVCGLLPPLFLMSYPVLPRLLEQCSKTLGKKVDKWYNNEPQKHFFGHFQGHLQNNRRFFAGLWLLYRLGLHANNAFASDCATSFAVQISLGTFFLLLHSILQPNRDKEYNILDSLFFANTVLLSTLGLVFWTSAGQDSDTNASTVVMAILLLLPYLYFSCMVVYSLANFICVKKCGCSGRQLQDQSPDELLSLCALASARLKGKCGGSCSRRQVQDQNPNEQLSLYDRLKGKCGGCWKSIKYIFGGDPNESSTGEQRGGYQSLNGDHDSLNSFSIVPESTLT